MHIFVLQILVALSCDVLRDLLRPFTILQDSAYAETSHANVELFPKKSSYIAKSHARIDGKLVI